ncbi:uncharacterized protein LOC125844602 [Solanum stenotomum]|uniref:uncharacterized protein LOC125844602 n=1 Tax=Solanum stenotomum TaxID=172797 RepID=UPI0020D11339|nr:uncharacterized protein LOC125844602 [Solanum stenotomum]
MLTCLKWTTLNSSSSLNSSKTNQLFVTIEMIKEAPTQGICFIFKKSLISSLKLKDVWKHVKWHNKKANEKSQHYNANQVYVMDNTSCPTKMQDKKGKSIVNCSETYQDQEVGSLIEKDEAKRFKRFKSTNEEAQVKCSGPSEKEEDHSLLSKISTERPEKKRRNLKWTAELDKKLDEVVRELGDKGKCLKTLFLSRQREIEKIRMLVKENLK